ncbi:Armadillo-like helical domain and Armadillo-type fold domain-containing protein [Strongyloides ratti]|uniref:Armadillo-like helical domain and Armadillo-type fold domain-containing protein n=1 Tax=Strongyloides ratti TaxID=34506 RepID=A0A090LJQ6_STRRB|nr:Armadillo-like helical domain and Armadillo-type fold domain-containing protein [Strongyloides ratti]CEF68363.1 Armadillo-like helical domain and Armadillo-type fold domain-containing protein [Strongyloides ratti]
MDSYNQYTPSPSISVSGTSPYSMCPTPSVSTLGYPMSNNSSQLGQMPTSSIPVVSCPTSVSVSGNYSYPQGNTYHQQGIGYNFNHSINNYQSTPTENCESVGRNFQTQQWMQNNYLDNTYYNQQATSGAPSVISNASYTSLGMNDNTSQISYQTNLTDVGRMGDIRSMLQMQNYASSVISCGENVDPSSTSLTDNFRANILNNLIDDDEEICKKALMIIENLSKKNSLQAKPFIIDIMDAIHNDSTTSSNMERLLKCLYYLIFKNEAMLLIISSLEICNFVFIDTLSRRMIKNQRYGKVALVIFFTLLSLPGETGKKLRKYARKEIIMDKLLDYCDKILNPSNITIDIRQYLYSQRKEIRWILSCFKLIINDNLRKYALSKKGILLLFNIIENTTLEDVQYLTLVCISTFISSRSIEYAEEFVKHGIIEKITSILDITSPSRINGIVLSQRIIVECYDILLSVSDTNNITTNIAANTVDFMLKELRKDDSIIIKYCTGFLCNLPSKSSAFKILLLEKEIIYLLLGTIRRYLEKCWTDKDKNELKINEEILDNCLTALKSLTSPNSNSLERIQYGMLIDKFLNIPESFQILMNLFINSVDSNKYRIITILHRFISFDSNDYLRSYNVAELLLKNVEYIIKVIFDKAKSYNTCNEKLQKNLKELIIRSISLLQYYVKDIDVCIQVIQLAEVLLNKDDNIVDDWLNYSRTNDAVKECSSSYDYRLKEVTQKFLKSAQEMRFSILTEEGINCGDEISLANIFAGSG